MRAVNLIPVDSRRSGGTTGNAVYVLLGVLGVLIVLVAAYTLAGRTVDERTQQLTAAQAEATAAEASVKSLQAYTDFAALSAKRVETVSQLAASRFDWGHALHEVARTIPSDVWLTSMRGTVSSTVSVEAGAGDTSGLRGQLSAPAIELVGCTVSQARVATMLADLRRIDGVQRVSLASSAKSGAGSGTAVSDGGGGGGDCRSSSKFPQFSVVVFYTPPTASTDAAAGTSTTQTASTPTTSTTETVR